LNINKLQETKLEFEKIRFNIKVSGKTIKNCSINQGTSKYFYRFISFINTLLYDHQWLNNKTTRKLLADSDERVSRIEIALKAALPSKEETFACKDKKLVAECSSLQRYLAFHLNQIHIENDRNDMEFIRSTTSGILNGYLKIKLSPKGMENTIELINTGVTFKNIFDHLNIPYESDFNARGRERINFIDAVSNEERKKRTVHMNALFEFLENALQTAALITAKTV